MKKISTLFKKDPNNLALIINEVNPENNWVFNPPTIATRKFDGTACAIIDGELYKRYDVKKGKRAPKNAIPCQKPDLITGHWPHWVKCIREDKSDQYHFEVFDLSKLSDGTFELVGPKIQGNPEKYRSHQLIRHGYEVVPKITDFEQLREYLTTHDIEGIVYHAEDLTGRMCKIRKSDFGLKR